MPGASKRDCTGLECNIVDCDGETTTTLTGTVHAPTPERSGDADPIYNAIVFTVWRERSAAWDGRRGTPPSC